MSFAQTVVLAAFAGGTIFLGLPVGRVRGLSRKWQAALTTAAGGVILFLIYDVLSQAVEPVKVALEAARGGGSAGDFVAYAATLGLSVAVGLLSVTYLTSRMAARHGGSIPITPRQVALGTAVGLGLHNFSEGLAIGQSAATGATAFALILVIGFALHNATEGFAIAAPLGQGDAPSWSFLGAAGVVGGGPTFARRCARLRHRLADPLDPVPWAGSGRADLRLQRDDGVSRRLSLPMVTGVALTIGLLAAFGTDFILTAAGA